MNGRSLLPGLCIASKPEWACVAASDVFGYGVITWHAEKKEAEHNANLIGGKAVPVDYINGTIIIPPLAEKIIKKIL